MMTTTTTMPPPPSAATAPSTAPARRAAPPEAPLQWVAATLLGLALLTAQWWQGSALRPTPAYPAWMLLCGLGVVALPRLAKPRPVVLDLPAFACGLLFLAWLLIASHLSPDASARGNYTRLGLSVAVAYLATATLITAPRPRRLLLLLLIAGALVQAAAALAQNHGFLDFPPQGWLSERLHIWYADTFAKRGSGTYLNANHLCWLLNATGLAALCFAFLGRCALPWKLACLLAGSGLLFGALQTTSRGGLLALAAAFTALALLGLCAVDFARRYQKVLLLLCLLAATLLPATALLRVARVDERISTRWEGLLFDNYRLTLWESAFTHIATHPLLGSGPGSFEWHARQERSRHGKAQDYFAHNDWLQTAGDLGIPAALLLLSATTLHLRAARRHYFATLPRLRTARLPQSNTAATALAAFTMGAAFAIHSYFDFNLHLPSNALLAGAVAGLMVSREGGSHALPPRRFPLLLLIASAVLLAMALWSGRAELAWLKAENQSLRGSPHAAYLTAREALARCGPHPGLAFLVGERLLQRARQTAHPGDRALLLHEADAAFRTTLPLAPWHYRLRLRVAETSLALGQTLTALNAAQRAIALCPLRPEGYLAAGLAHEQAGNMEQARAHYLQARGLWRGKPHPTLQERLRKKPPSPKRAKEAGK